MPISQPVRDLYNNYVEYEYLAKSLGEDAGLSLITKEELEEAIRSGKAKPLSWTTKDGEEVSGHAFPFEQGALKIREGSDPAMDKDRMEVISDNEDLKKATEDYMRQIVEASPNIFILFSEAVDSGALGPDGINYFANILNLFRDQSFSDLVLKIVRSTPVEKIESILENLQKMKFEELGLTEKFVDDVRTFYMDKLSHEAPELMDSIMKNLQPSEYSGKGDWLQVPEGGEELQKIRGKIKGAFPHTVHVQTGYATGSGTEGVAFILMSPELKEMFAAAEAADAKVTDEHDKIFPEGTPGSHYVNSESQIGWLSVRPYHYGDKKVWLIEEVQNDNIKLDKYVGKTKAAQGVSSFYLTVPYKTATTKLKDLRPQKQIYVDKGGNPIEVPQYFIDVSKKSLGEIDRSGIKYIGKQPITAKPGGTRVFVTEDNLKNSPYEVDSPNVRPITQEEIDTYFTGKKVPKKMPEYVVDVAAGEKAKFPGVLRFQVDTSGNRIDRSASDQVRLMLSDAQLKDLGAVIDTDRAEKVTPRTWKGLENVYVKYSVNGGDVESHYPEELNRLMRDSKAKVVDVPGGGQLQKRGYASQVSENYPKTFEFVKKLQSVYGDWYKMLYNYAVREAKKNNIDEIWIRPAAYHKGTWSSLNEEAVELYYDNQAQYYSDAPEGSSLDTTTKSNITHQLQGTQEGGDKFYVLDVDKVSPEKLAYKIDYGNKWNADYASAASYLSALSRDVWGSPISSHETKAFLDTLPMEDIYAMSWVGDIEDVVFKQLQQDYLSGQGKEETDPGLTEEDISWINSGGAAILSAHKFINQAGQSISDEYLEQVIKGTTPDRVREYKEYWSELGPIQSKIKTAWDKYQSGVDKTSRRKLGSVGCSKEDLWRVVEINKVRKMSVVTRGSVKIDVAKCEIAQEFAMIRSAIMKKADEGGAGVIVDIAPPDVTAPPERDGGEEDEVKQYFESLLGDYFGIQMSSLDMDNFMKLVSQEDRDLVTSINNNNTKMESWWYEYLSNMTQDIEAPSEASVDAGDQVILRAMVNPYLKRSIVGREQSAEGVEYIVNSTTPEQMEFISEFVKDAQKLTFRTRDLRDHFVSIYGERDKDYGSDLDEFGRPVA